MRQVTAKQQGEWFRMAIDRDLVVQGHGTVVTGSVTSGSARIDSELDWLPPGEKVRIRGLNHHNQTVEEVRRGQRRLPSIWRVCLTSRLKGAKSWPRRAISFRRAS